MVVIIRVNDDNYGTKDCFIAETLESAQKFICKDVECTMAELLDYEVCAVSRNCKVYNFDDELIYRIHLNPETV